MELLEAVGLAVAALIAGAINAVAGGGSLVTFPGLLAAGYDSKIANQTNTVAVWPGNVGGSLAYRGELANQKRNITMLALPTFAGALLGSIILLATPESTFRALVPFLILSACFILYFQDQLGRATAKHRMTVTGEPRVLLLQIAIFMTAIYGGYFGAGMGIIFLAILGLLLPDDIQNSNALKGLISVAVNGIAAVYFVFFGIVAWGPAVIMAIGSLVGGYLGVGVARRLNRERLRQVVVVYGVIAATVLFFR